VDRFDTNRLAAREQDLFPLRNEAVESLERDHVAAVYANRVSRRHNVEQAEGFE
jgi:hypothetical protein